MIRDREELHQILDYLDGFWEAQEAAREAYQEQKIRRDAATAARIRRSGKLPDGIVIEDREREAARVAVKLLKAISIDPADACSLLIAWAQTYCDPPLPEEEARDIFNRIARRQLAKETANG